MIESLLLFVIIVPIAGIIGIYRVFNNGEFPCMNTNFMRVFVSEND